jgi:hypothetical protein
MDVWWGVGFGRFFGNNLSLDLEYDEFEGTYRDYNVMVPGATFDQWGMSNVGVMGRYHFGDGNLRPYVAAGLGYLSHRNINHEGESCRPASASVCRASSPLTGAPARRCLWRGDNDGAAFAAAAVTATGSTASA